tara:strand:+ start:74 stop:634 length:561 start_codon:yes stop_codon:yes gene_type:complete
MPKKVKVIFLDRDGVVSQYPGDGKYVASCKEFNFIPGSPEGIKKLNQSGFKLFIISNQSGVAKGLYQAKDLEEIDAKMIKSLKKQEASLDGVYYCVHNPKDNCSCRKPKTGLLEKALLEANLKPDLTFFIGDSFVDMKTAKASGAKTVLLLSGKEKISNRANWEFEPDYIFDNLLVAAHYLSSHHG